MPKEQINYPVEPTDGIVRLHWSGPLSMVQLSIEFEVAQMRAYLAEQGKGAERLPWFTGTLDRDDVQRLIRFGRRARDQVFGSDE